MKNAKNVEMLMKSAAAIGYILMGTASVTAVQADTVVSITQVSYDYMNRPICAAVRMNMAVSQPADACTPSTTVGSDGPDRISKNVYDAAGQLLAVYQGVGTSSIRQYAYYNYTNNGLKSFEIDANHNKTTFTYDGFDRLSKVQYPNTTAGNEISSATDYETFGYDANSNRTSYRHRNAQTVLYTYDNINREIVKDLPAYAGSTATAKDIYTGYDGLGHIVYKRFASASGSGVSYAYDGLGRVSSTTDINNRTIWYGYFADSTRYYLQFPDSVIQGYAYDNKGALIATSSGAVGLGIAYNSLGKTVAITRSNSAGSYYAYDNVGRLSILRLEFAGTANDITWSLNAYNAASQITNWNASTAVYDYVESATDQTNKTYDGLNRDAAIAAVSGGYDAAGNMANDGVRTFTYDVENRLITGSSALTALALNYDPEGRLYSYSYNGSTTSFLYDGSALIGEYDASGNITRRYMHTLGTDQPWVQFTGSTVTAANATYLYSNYQGSIIAMADQNGAVAASDVFKYGPYGEPRNSANAESWTGNRFRYTGQTVIAEAKLYYYKARVYEPVAGRFLQTDPVGSKDDLDLYAYVGGDPINSTDPTGMVECIIGCFSSSNGDGNSGTTNQAFLAPPPPPAATPITTAPPATPPAGSPPAAANPWVAAAMVLIYAVSPSSTAPKEMDEPAQWLYHYTNEKGMKGIVSTMAILPSLKSVNPQRARFGSGQYFTDIAPGTLPQADLSRRLQTNPNGDYTHWVRVNVNGLGVLPVAGRPGSYLVPSHWPLQIGNRFGGAGAN